MAEQLLEQARDLVDGPIDFEGQRLCDQLTLVLLSVVGAVSFLAGYVLQDITLSVYIALGGTALTFLVTIPPWPFYNKHPVSWLPVGGNSASTNSIPQTIVIDEKAMR